MSSSFVPDISLNQTMSTEPLKPLDICGICPECKDDCPMLSQCALARGLTIDLLEIRHRARLRPGASETYLMGVSMCINDDCDMRGARTVEEIIARSVRYWNG